MTHNDREVLGPAFLFKQLVLCCSQFISLVILLNSPMVRPAYKLTCLSEEVTKTRAR